MHIRLTNEEEKQLNKLAEERNMTKTDILKQGLYIPKKINTVEVYRHIMNVSTLLEKIEAYPECADLCSLIREELVNVCHILNS